MTPQQDYAVTQHDSCCKLLGLDPAHNAAASTLWDVLRDLLAERETLKTELDAATCLHTALQQGIAATPDRTLSDDVLAAFRMPMQASMFTKATKGFPKGARCTQRGLWFLILKP